MSPPEKGQASEPFEVTPDMIKAGVGLYFAFNYEEDEPETLVAEILLTARDMLVGKLKCEL